MAFTNTAEMLLGITIGYPDRVCPETAFPLISQFEKMYPGKGAASIAEGPGGRPNRRGRAVAGSNRPLRRLGACRSERQSRNRGCRVGEPVEVYIQLYFRGHLAQIWVSVGSTVMVTSGWAPGERLAGQGPGVERVASSGNVGRILVISEASIRFQRLDEVNLVDASDRPLKDLGGSKGLAVHEEIRRQARSSPPSRPRCFVPRRLRRPATRVLPIYSDFSKHPRHPPRQVRRSRSKYLETQSPKVLSAR